MTQVARRFCLCNMDISSLGANANTPAVQVPNGATKMTVQFNYKFITSPVLVTMMQSVDGISYNECHTVKGMPVTIKLDTASTSATLLMSELSAKWIRFKVEKGSSSHGTLEKLFVLFAA